MSQYLLIDFGASRIKAGVYEKNSKEIVLLRDYSVPPSISDVKGRYEISLNDLSDIFVSICKFYLQKFPISGIFICSQMHGFVLINEKAQPLTNYISWKDERSLENGLYNKALSSIGNKYKKITGMAPRPSLPFFNIISVCKQFKIKKARVLTLPDWLALISHDSCFKSHETMLAGLGIYDIFAHSLSTELVDYIKNKTGAIITANDCCSHDTISGYFHWSEKKIPIYAGIGDHQCAILGAGNIPNKTISINIGTGSQVSFISKNIPESREKIDIRPYFSGQFLETITHIPAGRAIDSYLDIFGQEKKKIWAEIGKVNIEDIKNSDLEFNLNIFKSAWKYNDSEWSIKFADEKKLNKENYLSSLIRCLTEQYKEAMNIIGYNKKTIILSGGIPKKIPQLRKILGGKLLKENQEETLLGLRKIVDAISHEQRRNC